MKIKSRAFVPELDICEWENDWRRSGKAKGKESIRGKNRNVKRMTNKFVCSNRIDTVFLFQHLVGTGKLLVDSLCRKARRGLTQNEFANVVVLRKQQLKYLFVDLRLLRFIRQASGRRGRKVHKLPAIPMISHRPTLKSPLMLFSLASVVLRSNVCHLNVTCGDESTMRIHSIIFHRPQHNSPETLIHEIFDRGFGSYPHAVFV